MNSANLPVNIVCLKWGDKYPAEYVNRLYRMVSNQLSIPFEFYCLTENTQGIDPGINILALEIEPGLKGWWYKLQLFKPDFYGLTGQVMFLDLDVVIVNNMDALFSYHPNDFVIIKDLKPGLIYNSSVFKFSLGSRPEVWQRFLDDKNAIMARMHGDQDWISEVINDAVLWPKDWVVSFKKECNARTKHSFGRIGEKLRKHGFLMPKGEAVPPADAKLVYFHGKPDPDDVAEHSYGMYKAAPWIKKHWGKPL
jgi:hypothetical protein